MPYKLLLTVYTQVLRLRRYERLSVQNQRFCRNGGAVNPKFQVELVVPHQPYFFSVNYAKLSLVWYINLDRSFYRFVTMHACDGRTDGETDGWTDGQNSHR